MNIRYQELLPVRLAKWGGMFYRQWRTWKARHVVGNKKFKKY
jgi:hypothetical protein